MMTCTGYMYLLRHMLAGGEVPYYSTPLDLLSDVLCAYTIEGSTLRSRAEIAEMRESEYRPAIGQLWAMVFAAGKRKTMRTEDVRSALESTR